jgi:flavin reductase (DIM6/NTAB) family NADH-FMN oxidoreductase RutF
MITDPLRAAAGRLTTGVTVLTVAHGDTLHGATVSTALPVARVPLIVSAGLRRGSVLTGLAVASGRFAINVLSNRQGPLAEWFGDPRRPAGRRQFDLIDWTADPATGLPLLRRCLANLLCRVYDLVPAGDHDLLLGEVTTAATGVGQPLLSFAGDLHAADLRGLSRTRGVAAAGAVTLD